MLCPWGLRRFARTRQRALVTAPSHFTRSCAVEDVDASPPRINLGLIFMRIRQSAHHKRVDQRSYLDIAVLPCGPGLGFQSQGKLAGRSSRGSVPETPI